MNNQSPVNLSHKVPTVAFDNYVMNLKSDGQVDILFYQVTTEGVVNEADVVAAIRIPNTARLEEMKGSLANALEDIKKHEP